MMTDKQATELTKRLTVYAAIFATCILFGSIIAHDAGKAVNLIMGVFQ